MIDLTDREKIDIFLRALQDSIPESVMYKKKEVQVKGATFCKLACNRAIWYIMVKGYGISTASQIAAQRYRQPPHLVEKGVRGVFPKNYFVGMEKGKTKNFLKKME